MDLDITVESAYPDDRETQRRATQDLRAELRRQGIIASPPATPLPTGAKSGDAAAIGQLVVTGLLSASALTAMSRVAIAFINRKSAQRITITAGETKLEIVGELDPAQREILARLLGAADRP